MRQLGSRRTRAETGVALPELYPRPNRAVRGGRLRQRIRGERPAHAATTRHMQAVYPFMAEGGITGRGIYIGVDAYGGSFTYDPWVLYELGVVTNPNMVILGHVGKAKSSLAKTMIYRQHAFGRVAWVLDRKGEYEPLARALGVTPIRLAPGGSVRVNPLVLGAGDDAEAAQLSLLEALAAAALDRALEPEEAAGLREALRVLNAERSEPVLPEVVELLLRPRDAMAERLASTVTRLAESVRKVALGLDRLCEGDLRGMFDGPTTTGLDLEGPLVVIDLSGIPDSASLGIVMTCAAAWQRAHIRGLLERADAAGRPAPKIINLLDEGWRFIGHLGTARWLQEAFKLVRGFGMQNVIVFHRLTDLQSAGGRDSQQVRIAEGLISDTETRVIYGQSADQVPVLRDVVAPSETELELIPQLGKGQAIWQVGRRSSLVQHRVSPAERQIVDTDARMRLRHDDPPGASGADDPEDRNPSTTHGR